MTVPTFADQRLGHARAWGFIAHGGIICDCGATLGFIVEILARTRGKTPHPYQRQIGDSAPTGPGSLFMRINCPALFLSDEGNWELGTWSCLRRNHRVCRFHARATDSSIQSSDCATGKTNFVAALALSRWLVAPSEECTIRYAVMLHIRCVIPTVRLLASYRGSGLVVHNSDRILGRLFSESQPNQTAQPGRPS